MEVVVTTGAIRRDAFKIILRFDVQSNRLQQQTKHPTFYRPDAIPVAQPAVSKHWSEAISIWISFYLCEDNSEFHNSPDLLQLTTGEGLSLMASDHHCSGRVSRKTAQEKPSRIDWFFTGRMPFLTPDHHCRSTEGTIICPYLYLQCCDTVGWATGRAFGLQKAGCWFVGGNDLTGALQHVIAPLVTTTYITP